MTTSSREIQAEIEAQIRKGAEIRLKSEAEAEALQDEIRAETPVETGEAAASVHVEKRKDRDGLPRWWVGTRLWYFHFLEYGTKSDTRNRVHVNDKRPREGRKNVPGEGDSRIVETGSGEFVELGPNTPTPEFAPFAKVAHRHGGTMGKGGGVEV